MTSYLAARVIRLVLVWIGITLGTFGLLRLSGDPARLILGELASAEAVREFQRLHGLDRPLPAQYAAFVGGIVVGDFGRSLRFEQPILPIILERLPANLVDSVEFTGAGNITVHAARELDREEQRLVNEAVALAPAEMRRRITQRT